MESYQVSNPLAVLAAIMLALSVPAIVVVVASVLKAARKK